MLHTWWELCGAYSQDAEAGQGDGLQVLLTYQMPLWGRKLTGYELSFSPAIISFGCTMPTPVLDDIPVLQPSSSFLLFSSHYRNYLNSIFHIVLKIKQSQKWVVGKQR